MFKPHTYAKQAALQGSTWSAARKRISDTAQALKASCWDFVSQTHTLIKTLAPRATLGPACYRWLVASWSRTTRTRPHPLSYYIVFGANARRDRTRLHTIDVPTGTRYIFQRCSRVKQESCGTSAYLVVRGDAQVCQGTYTNRGTSPALGNVYLYYPTERV